jgi:hypothetical protein
MKFQITYLIHMRCTYPRILALALCCALSPAVRGATIYQATNGTYVAWEAEDILSTSNNPPTLWGVTNDASASGTLALYASGVNQTANPASFASYSILFRVPGTYSLYLRWRADKQFTDLDPNSGNSYFRPNDFGDLGPEAANYATSSINNSRTPPAVNSYAVSVETLTYTVSQAQVDAGHPLILKLGTREAGLFLDRFILSSNPLTEPDFNALPNSETDLVPQGATDNYVAFEAERFPRIVNNSPTFWGATNDAPASGGGALYASGVNQTATPASFASYLLRFRTAGTYSFYLRWRADKNFTDLDPNSGNSYFRPNDFGDLGPEVANYATSSINNSRTPPAVNSYAVSVESLTYAVSQAQVDAGQQLVLKLGTREAGLFIDRIILSTNSALTEAEFNALPNSGSAARPKLVEAVGSASMTNITVTFDRPLDGTTVTKSAFTLSGGLGVNSAVLNTNTSKDVLLSTTPQAEGSNYVVTVNGVKDVGGIAIAPDSTVSFTSWRVASGWITRELYYGLTGGTVSDLQANPKYPDSPDALAFVKTVSLGNDLQVGTFGARFRGFFVPPQDGNYEFYLYADDDAVFSISSNESAANLSFGIQSVAGLLSFDPSASYTAQGLLAGHRYLFEVLYAQNNGLAAVGLGARRVGTLGNIPDIPLLGGSLVATSVDPDAGAVSITQQPVGGTVPAGQRLRMSVKATAVTGGTLFYQWQVDGINIPGANRATYVTPVLSAPDSGKKYRCVIGVNGTDVPTQEATVVVGPAQPVPLTPYVGINFVGGGDAGTTVGGTLATTDVGGAVLQGFFNNVAGKTIDGTQVLFDAQGTNTPVTVAVWDPVAGAPVAPAGAIGTGTGEASAEHVMMQGYLANNNTPLSILLGSVPPGTYNLVAYSVGFSFNSTYEEDFALVGAATYPTLTVRGQSSLDFIANPTLVRMTSTNALNRDLGNYVMFEKVSPAGDGTLLLTITPQSTNVGNTAYFPPLNALQLVKVNPLPPTLAAAKQGTNLAISWSADAAGYVLESNTNLAAGASWTFVQGTPNPITGAGSANIPIQPGAQYFRLKK